MLRTVMIAPHVLFKPFQNCKHYPTRSPCHLSLKTSVQSQRVNYCDSPDNPPPPPASLYFRPPHRSATIISSKPSAAVTTKASSSGAKGRAEETRAGPTRAGHGTQNIEIWRETSRKLPETENSLPTRPQKAGRDIFIGQFRKQKVRCRHNFATLLLLQNVSLHNFQLVSPP